MANIKSVTDHLGNTFHSKGEMLKHYGISYKAFDKRIASGMSLKTALTTPVGKLMSNRIPCVDHLGNHFESKAAMLKHYGLCQTAFNYRINKLHMSLVDALTQPHTEHKSTAIECTDHLGNKFHSKAEMCDYWRMPRVVFFRRIRDGWSLEKSLTEPIKNSNPIKSNIRDHNNNEYSTIDEMCKYWNISKKQYMLNIRNNCTIEEALTTVTHIDGCIDHKGNKYASINEMCRTYGITKTTLRSRIELGWTLADILENPAKKHNHIRIKDHLGNEYENRQEMLTKYNVYEATFKYRKALGWTLQECLEGKTIEPVSDHLGNQFNTVTELCIYWNIPESTFYGRTRDLKWPIDKALITITKESYDTFGKDLTIQSHICDGYYEIIFKENYYIWHVNQIMEYYRNNTLYKYSGIKLLKRINEEYYEIETHSHGKCIMSQKDVLMRLKTARTKNRNHYD